MKRPAFVGMSMTTFAIAVAAMGLTAPIALAQTDIENDCRSAGGEYSSQEVQARWGAKASLIETCCSGTGASHKCVTYRDGVQGPTYGGG
jgi:hypothetical protein